MTSKFNALSEAMRVSLGGNDYFCYIPADNYLSIDGDFHLDLLVLELEGRGWRYDG